MRIQHNIAALNSYRNLTTNNSAVSKNLEKLSSGYRINRAGDDAAGLAISEKMRAQITGLKTAQKNANDGISLVQTAEGALTEVHSMLNRMVELADQSANGTYADKIDRENLQKEITSLKDEINRIADATNFNGINLLDGSMEQKTVVTAPTDVTVTHKKDGVMAATGQVGIYSLDLSQVEWKSSAADQEAKITFAGVDIGAKTLGDGDTYTGKELATAFMTKVTNDGVGTGAATGEFVDAAGTKYTVEHDGNGKLTFTMKEIPTTAPTQAMSATASSATDLFVNQGEGLAVTVEQEAEAKGDRMYAQGEFSLTTDMVKDGSTLTIGDSTYVFAVGKDSAYKGSANVIDLTDMEAADITTANLKTVGGRLTKAAAGNKNFIVATSTQDAKILLTEKEGGVDYSKNNLEGTSTAAGDAANTDWAGLVKTGTVDASKSSGGLTLQIGDTSADFNQLTVSVGDMHAKALGIADIDISTQAGAKAAVDKIKDAINSVSSTRGDLGAIQNRLEHTINNLSVTTENMTAAESRIRDVDMAEEMMAYTKNNILVQASQAMLAQANQIPQGVLQLLQ